LECQAEIYEYLAGTRDDAPIEELELRIERINATYSESLAKSQSVSIPIFDPRPGRQLLERIQAYME
jgi:hypothetical protein